MINESNSLSRIRFWFSVRGTKLHIPDDDASRTLCGRQLSWYGWHPAAVGRINTPPGALCARCRHNYHTDNDTASQGDTDSQSDTELDVASEGAIYIPERLSDVDIRALGVSQRVHSRLHESGFERLHDLDGIHSYDLLMIDNFGPAALREVFEAINELVPEEERDTVTSAESKKEKDSELDATAHPATMESDLDSPPKPRGDSRKGLSIGGNLGENRGILPRLLAWARISRDVTTLADFAQVNIFALLTELGVSEQQAHELLITVPQSSLRHFQLGQAFADALDSLDDRRREIFVRRTFSPKPETLSSIAEDFDVSRERIRQLEADAREAIDATVGKQIEGGGRRLRRAFGIVTIAASLRTAVDHMTEDGPRSLQRYAGHMLLRHAGYEFEGDLAVTEEYQQLVNTIEERARQLADERGIVSEATLKKRIEGRYEETPDIWSHLVASSRLERLHGSLVLRKTNRIKVVLALKEIGRPATRDEIANLAGLDLRQTASILSNEADIVRVTKGTWGFERWTDDAFDGVVGEMIQRIEEDGGETTLYRLLEEIPRKFGVSENTVRTYLNTKRFQVKDGKVSLEPSPDVELRPLEMLDEVVWSPHDRPVFRFKIEDHYLRGHSIKIPNEVAAYLGVQINERESFPVVEPDIGTQVSVIWRAHDPSGPEIGRLRETLEALGAALNQEVFLELDPAGLRCVTDGSQFTVDRRAETQCGGTKSQDVRRGDQMDSNNQPKKDPTIEKLKSRRRISDLKAKRDDS